MDLPSCPACNQSVLDDGASHCPFCGASMSGDGGSVPVESAPASTEASDERATTDDPFEISSPVAHRGLATAPRPSKQRPWRVVCPMCETAGYIPRKAAGREITCSNPDCLVPLFTAPAAPNSPKPTNEIPSQQASTRRPLFTVVILLFVVGLAGGVGWLLWKPSGRPSPAPPTGLSTTTQFGQLSAADEPAIGEPPQTPSVTDEATATQAPNSLTPAQIRARAYEAMIAAAQSPTENRSKPFCRRLNAETFAAAGAEPETLTELKQLTEVGPDLPHLHITPLVALWWSRQANGQPAHNPYLQEALQRSNNLSSRDTYAVDAAIALGAALVASHQDALARETIDRLWFDDEPQRLRLDQSIARQTLGFRLPLSSRHRTLLASARSPDTLIIRQLVARGHSASALAWSQGSSLPLTRGDRLAAWAGGECRGTEREAVSRILGVLADESALLRARVLARTALMAFSTSDQTLAAELAAAAEAALKECPAPRPVILGDLRQTYQQEVSDPTDWWLQVQARACLVATRFLEGNTTSAGSHFQAALSAARCIGPTQGDIRGRIRDMKSAGTARFLQVVKTALDLTGDDEAQQAVQVYRRHCTDWLALADQRADCLARLHRWAVHFGQIQAAWDDVRTVARSNDITKRDLFSTTTLPSFLFLRFKIAGNENGLKQMKTAFPGDVPTDFDELLRQKTEAALVAGDLPACVLAINKDKNARRKRTARFSRRRLMFHLVGQAAASRQPARALDLIAAFRDSGAALWREDAYRLTAARLATNRLHAIVWEHAMNSNRPSTERIALLAGLLEGLTTLAAGT